MVAIGKRNKLKIVKEVDFGVYLDGGDAGEILLPRNAEPKQLPSDFTVDVFIYLDSEDRLIATTAVPYAMVGEVAYLEVTATTSIGAFLNWGLSKDLLVPFREQKQRMEQGKSYLVYIYLDELSNRIAATSKLERALGKEPADYSQNQEVEVFISGRTDIGYNAVVEHKHWGLLYHNEVFQDLHYGQKLKAYIKKMRIDGKIDLSLQPQGYQKIDAISQGILDKIKAEGGYLEVTDKSPSELISELFGLSKRNYKKAVGTLYKQKLIKLEDAGIRLVEG